MYIYSVVAAGTESSQLQTYMDFLSRVLSDTHWPTLAFGMIAIVIMLLVKIIIDPYLISKYRTPFPTEMAMVVLSIAVSRHFDLKSLNFRVIEDIPNV